ncbi:HSP20 family molecular chaperone IbpA [Kroppenstedtia sanguinis]|uniref:Hsp20/alpha crystallin family protein n=1 Tax=Kroppenstedtia sanguinis TaxID=1380684 RepID=A0ABW4CA24_9BACL
MGWLRPWFESMLYEEMGEMWLEMERLSHELDPNRTSVRCEQTPTEVVVQVDIPSLNPRHEMDVRVEDNVLFISGSTGRDEVRERRQFQFTLHVYLPIPVEPSGMITEMDPEAKRLTVRLPKGRMENK